MNTRKVMLIASNRDFDTYKVTSKNKDVIVIHEKDDNSLYVPGTFKVKKTESQAIIKVVEKHLANGESKWKIKKILTISHHLKN